MKNSTITVIMAAIILIAGCSKKAPDNSGTPSPASAQAGAASSSPAASALTAWQQGDKASAVSSFLAADWSARPLFAAGSPLNLSEAKFMALPVAERQAKSGDITSQISALKQLGQAVEQAGSDAATKGDAAQARIYFASLKQFGAALEGPDHTQLVQLIGKSFVKMADSESARVGL